MNRYLRLHKAAKHECIKYSCEDCDIHATQQKTLKQHKESKQEGIRYSCTQCDYKGRVQLHFINHQQIIHEGIRYACDQCDYLATHVYILKLHQINQIKLPCVLVTSVSIKLNAKTLLSCTRKPSTNMTDIHAIFVTLGETGKNILKYTQQSQHEGLK